MQLLVNHEWSVPTSPTGTKCAGPILAEMLGWASKYTTYTMHLGYQMHSNKYRWCNMYVKCRNSGRPPKAFCKKDGDLFTCTILLISAHRCNSDVLGKRGPLEKISGTCPFYKLFLFWVTGMTPWKLVSLFWKRNGPWLKEKNSFLIWGICFFSCPDLGGFQKHPKCGPGPDLGWHDRIPSGSS